jgi:hypothetical protein
MASPLCEHPALDRIWRREPEPRRFDVQGGQVRLYREWCWCRYCEHWIDYRIRVESTYAPNP